MKSLSRLGAIVRKEVRQLRRDRLTFGMVIGLPIVLVDVSMPNKSFRRSILVDQNMGARHVRHGRIKLTSNSDRSCTVISH